MKTKIKLITDGDVAGALLVTDKKYNIDLFLGIGGGPEGVLAASAIDAFGCKFQGRFIFNTDKDISLTTFRSPVYDNLEVHGMEYTSDGTAKMKNVPILTIPANGEAILGKGGLHLMFMGNRRDIQLGEEILVVTFDTDEVRYMLNFKVIDPRESIKHDHSHDHHMH